MSEGSSELRSHYDSYYEDGAVGEWRRIGAVDKAANIARAWRVSGERSQPSVIEIGCGDGAVGARLGELDFFGSYIGYDISQSGIDAARTRHVVDAAFATFDGDVVPEPDDSFDLAILTHVIEHLEHPRRLLAEARRLARLTVIEVPLELNRRLPDDYDWHPVGHINKYNRSSVRQLVQSSQFDVVEQFTTCQSRAVLTFQRDGANAQLKWAVKEAALRTCPPVARWWFTYHETLLVQGNDRVHAAADQSAQ